MATNPILTEINGLSPGAKTALLNAHSASAPPDINAGAQAPKIDAGTRQAVARLQAPGAAPGPAMMGAPPMPNPAPNLGAPKPASVTQMSPLQEQTQKDEGERQRLLDTGSGIHQIKNPVLKGLAGIGNAIGSIAAPGLMREIPGTEEHHNLLLGQNEKNIGNDLGIGQKEATIGETQARTSNIGATTAHTAEETSEMPQEAADKHVLTNATVGNLNSEVADRGKPKDDWKELTGYAGPNGEPLEINAATGATRPAQGAPAGTKPTSKKESNPAQETYDSLISQGLTPMQAYEKIREKPGGTVINQGTWALDEDPATGKPILFNSKTGETKAAPPGVAKAGTFAKGQAAKEPATQALSYADSYENGIHTGPGDEALMEKYFELAKPSTGFRMSQPQIDMEMKARTWAGSLEAHLRHMTTGTWFSDEQRKQIIDTMRDLAKAKGIAGDGSGGTQTFTDNGVTYNIPTEHVAEFKKDHPNAK